MIFTNWEGLKKAKKQKLYLSYVTMDMLEKPSRIRKGWHQEGDEYRRIQELGSDIDEGEYAFIRFYTSLDAYLNPYTRWSPETRFTSPFKERITVFFTKGDEQAARAYIRFMMAIK